MNNHASTLAQTEKALAPLVWAVWVTCTGAGIASFWLHVEPLALVAWTALAGSNVVFFVQHKRVSVGMLPIAIASLAPAATSAVFGAVSGPARMACMIACAVSCGAIAVFAFWFLRLWAASHSQAEIADDAVIIVLGGAVVNRQPRPTLALRLDVAYELAEDHPRRTLVLTGGPLHNEPGTEAEAMALYLQNKGIPAGQLLLELRARNTRENIKNSCELIADAKHTRQLCVLTSDYHLYRAVREGRALGIELIPIPAPVPLGGRLQQWCREVLTILAGG